MRGARDGQSGDDTRLYAVPLPALCGTAISVERC